MQMAESIMADTGPVTSLLWRPENQSSIRAALWPSSGPWGVSQSLLRNASGQGFALLLKQMDSDIRPFVPALPPSCLEPQCVG